MAKKIVLVHGLGSVPDKTWGGFPELLAEDNDLDYEVIQYGYESPRVIKQFWKRAPSILNIAEGMITDLKHRCDLEKDEIILVGHSLGGLIVKKALIRLKSKQSRNNIKKVCFFDVPHDGSGFANVGKYIAWRNIHLKSLCRDSSELDELNDQWIENDFNSAFDVLSVIAANDDIVSSSSSKSIFRNEQVETINDVNHSTIVKPVSANSSSYIVLKDFILKKRTLSKYKNSASREVGDWLRFDDRNHEYQFVSDEKRLSDLTALVDAIKENQPVIRISGASGLGKTRLIIEALEELPEFNEECILVFDAPRYEKEIKNSIRRVVGDNAYGLAIIENCSVDFHNELRKEVIKSECDLRLITVAYSHNTVDDSIHIQIEPLSDDAINAILKPILVNMEEGEIERVAKFAQGYPLLAVLMADQYKSEGRIIGSINIRSIVNKLIKGDTGITQDEHDVLKACSLFDVFGLNEGRANEEAKFIAEDVAHSNLSIFDKVILEYGKKQLISRAGRYARIVPKPLALTLAIDWWSDTNITAQAKLIELIPDSLLQGFCTQISYLDDQPNVQKFAEEIFTCTSFFGQAEVLFTEKGSKLFRALTEVNPEATSKALYSILHVLTPDELKLIDGDVRRNLVWGLEKLCYREDVFEKSSKSLLLLASAENENWSNNATGQFLQLFRAFLSGTEATPEKRLEIIDYALKSDKLEIRKLAVDALNAVIDTHGGSRTVGAEYQGSGQSLVEWRPKIWQEAFDYWIAALERLTSITLENSEISQAAKDAIGTNIRGLVQRSRDVTIALDSAIKQIVTAQGPLWLSALDSIKTTISFDTKKMPDELRQKLDEWVYLLTPDNLEERIALIVSKPPYEHEKGEDGHFIDIAAINAEKFAQEFKDDISQLLPCLPQLLKEEQRQAAWFGRNIVLTSGKWEPLISETIRLVEGSNGANISFLMGLLGGIYQTDKEEWEKYICLFQENKNLLKYYPDVIGSGLINRNHLSVVLKLIENDEIDESKALVFTYGRALEHLPSDVVTQFIDKLRKVSSNAAWVGLDVLSMYCHGDKDKWESCKSTFKELIIDLPLDIENKNRSLEVHHWKTAVEKILDDDSEFSIKLVAQILRSCNDKMDYSDLHHYIKPTLRLIFSKHGTDVWPLVAEAIRTADPLQKYRLTQLLTSEDSFNKTVPSVLSDLPDEVVEQWCEAEPDKAPEFIALATEVYIKTEDSYKVSDRARFLLDKYGDNKKVLSALTTNMGSFGWRGSVVPIYTNEIVALKPFLKHKFRSVQEWAETRTHYLKRSIERESIRDEESEWGIY